MSDVARIRVLVLDIDGVLTTGHVAFTEGDQEVKSLFYRDIDAVYEARRQGLQVVLVTGERSLMVEAIARRLAVDVVIDDAKDKAAALQEVCVRLDVSLGQVCYVGDADRDASALALAGLSIAPNDASPAARGAAQRVVGAPGGRGAVAEALGILLQLNSATAGPRVAGTSSLSYPDTSAFQELITASLQESITVKQMTLDTLTDALVTAAGWMTETLRRGRQILLFGNGGSAADAQHVAAEFIGKFERKGRPAWPAIALTTDTSVLTALGNDFGFETIFARQVEALGWPGDLVLAFSTSGNSPDVLQGAQSARRGGLRVIGLTGQDGGQLAPLCDLVLSVPSHRTARIQESHIAMCHALCEVVEAALAKGQA